MIILAGDKCIEKEIFLNILTENRAGGYMYILESFDKELYERDLKQDAYEEGLQDGESNKLISLIKIKLAKGKSVEQIADELEEATETIQKLVEEINNK